MERTKQKSRKDKPNKVLDKGKSSSFITDVKLFKENLKIKEILRTVKMNSSMRIKAPRGSKVMQNKDFIENEDLFEGTVSDEDQDKVVPPSATNTVLNADILDSFVPEEEYENDENNSKVDVVETKFINENGELEVEASAVHKCKSISEGLENRAEFDNQIDETDGLSDGFPAESPAVRSRDRKLSLDHTILSRREGLSQSELDLHAIGKLPLERKSSFFRKKMDSFLKNTTEIFKRQSLGSKSVSSPLVHRRGSNCSRMSVSLQSLNENSAYGERFDCDPIEKYYEEQGSVASVSSCTTTVRSNSTASVAGSDRQPEMSEEESLAGSRQELVGSQPLPDASSLTIPYLRDMEYMQESLLSERASSMSSGLDTATGQRRRNTSRSNRVSWLASESLTDYFRRLIQDEKGQETQDTAHSYQDFSAIPENKYGPRPDSKGRRLSYVRAVSREDPVLTARSQESTLRIKNIPEYEVKARKDIETLLGEFAVSGIPPVSGYTEWIISESAAKFLEVFGADDDAAIVKDLDWGPAFVPAESRADAGPLPTRKQSSTSQTSTTTSHLSVADNTRHEVLRELIHTEAVHIRYLQIIVRVYVAAAHALQSMGGLADIDTSLLFLNIPDILNANMKFWERAIYPMLEDARKNRTFFNTSLMIPGLYDFAEIFAPYEEYMESQAKAVNYLRTLNSDKEFMTYLIWCDLNTGHRLQLSDMLVKPMQRITKYALIISRIIQHSVDDDKRKELEVVENLTKSFIASINRSCRQAHELDVLAELKIEPYALQDFKGDTEIENTYKNLTSVNLFIPMVGCANFTMRSLIHSGDLRYKDHVKEFDAHVLLFTDMILVCKVHKSSKTTNRWKLQRPRILLHRVVPNMKRARSVHDPPTLVFMTLDEHGCVQGVFQLSETSKDPNPLQTIKVWESKIFEAMICYTLTKWYYRYPVRDVAIIAKDHNDDTYKKEHPEMSAAEKNARERVAAMFYPNKRLIMPDAGKEMEIPQTAYERERGPMELNTIYKSGQKHFNAWQSRAMNFHGRPKGLGCYSFTNPDVYVSLSESSHDEGPHSLTLQWSDSSVEQHLSTQNFEEFHKPPVVTVNIPSIDSSARSQQQSPPTLVLQQPSPSLSPEPRSASAGADYSLRVATATHSMIHSLPDINAELHRPPDPPVVVQSASAKMYRSHQELLQRKRLAASQLHLGPDHRGSSYPPPSPTRPLIRGLAFSYSFRGHTHSTPPLQRSQHVDISPQHASKDLLTVKRIFGIKSSTKDPPSRPRSPSPSTAIYRPDLNKPSTSADICMESQNIIMRQRSAESRVSASPQLTRGEQSDDSNYDADDDRSRRSSKSNKDDRRPLLDSWIQEDQDIAVEEQLRSEESEKRMDSRGRVKKGKGKSKPWYRQLYRKVLSRKSSN